MKIRAGFVSNSSSSSFVISKDNLTGKQIKLIKAHSIKGKEFGIPYGDSDPWSIAEDDDYIKGSTWMDNFDMSEYLSKIGVPSHEITWTY
jgi:hypothetical protein